VTGGLAVGFAGKSVIETQVAPRVAQMQREADLRDKLIVEYKKQIQIYRDQIEAGDAREEDLNARIANLNTLIAETTAALKAQNKALDSVGEAFDSKGKCEKNERPSIFDGGDLKFDYPQKKK
jgi:capsule polysaccharide export protein KpsE/RkpR